MLNRPMRQAAALLALFLLTACTGQTNAGQPQATTVSAMPTSVQPQSSSLLAQTQPAVMESSPAARSLPTPTTQETAPAIACTRPMPFTDALTEGPYFKAGSPERASLLEPGMNGQKLVLSGHVLTQDCQPVAHALLDFWQADASGQYDNSGYTLRGHQYTDAQGHYQLETIIPGLYPGRTEHIHLKVQAPNGPILTTQLFFPGVTSNDQDSIYDPKMLITVQDTQDGELGAFNFVVSAP